LDTPIVARAAEKGDSAMVIQSCKHECTKKHGRDPYGNPRRRCCLCGKTWIEKAPQPLGDMRVDIDTAKQALRLLNSSFRESKRGGV